MIIQLEKSTDDTFGPSYRCECHITSQSAEDNTTRIKLFRCLQKDLTHISLSRTRSNARSKLWRECPVELELNAKSRKVLHLHLSSNKL